MPSWRRQKRCNNESLRFSLLWRRLLLRRGGNSGTGVNGGSGNGCSSSSGLHTPADNNDSWWQGAIMLAALPLLLPLLLSLMPEAGSDAVDASD